MGYKISFFHDWDIYFAKMDKTARESIWNKIQKQKEETKTRHLKHGLDFYVIEAGQYRIVIKINEKEKVKEIHFVGNHKQYERWYKQSKD